MKARVPSASSASVITAHLSSVGRCSTSDARSQPARWIHPPSARRPRVGTKAPTVPLLLASVVSPWWLLLTAFVGLNLLQSSVTGFCPAAVVFKRFGVKGGCAFS
ncbi:MAG: DUF2892 domain-containing protein [Nocardioides sp.]|nr:DUF2892 domain-containing protein [Nocardioides sp.]